MPFAVLLVAATAQAPTDSVYGIVRATGTTELIPQVQVTVAGETRTALSDARGRYVLRQLAGAVTLRFQRLGFQTLMVTVLLPANGGTRVDVDLMAVPVNLSTLTFPSSRAQEISPGSARVASEIGFTRVTPAAARRNPLVGEPSVFRALGAAPSVGGREESAGGLQVRGGAVDETLVMLDGLPWRGPRPFGGLAGPLPDGAVAAAEFHSAVPPARYGDAVSAVIALRPRSVSHQRPIMEGVVDPTSAEGTIGLPLPLHGADVLLSGSGSIRGVYGGSDQTGEGPNGFSDVLGRVSLPAGGGSVRLYWVASRQQLAFPASTDTTSQAATQNTQQVGSDAAPGEVPSNRFAWSGTLAGAVWSRALGPQRSAHARLWYGGVSGTVAWNAVSAADQLHDRGFAADVQWGSGEAGLQIERIGTAYRVGNGVSITSLVASPVVTAAFASRQWEPARHWTVSTGLRVSHAPGWAVHLEPRLWTRLDLAPRLSAAIGYAGLEQYVQSARNEESVLDAVLASDLPIAAGTGSVRPARAEQLMGSVQAGLGERASLKVEGYLRRLSGLALVAPVSPLPFALGAPAEGRALIRGADATAAYDGPRLAVRGQLALVRTSYVSGPVSYMPSGAIGRLALGAAYSVPRVARISLGMWAGVGRPTTPIDNGFAFEPYVPLGRRGELAGSPVAEPGPLNADRLPAYWRVDLGLSREWTLATPGGNSRFSASAMVTNLLNHQNVLGFVGDMRARHLVLWAPRALTLRIRWSTGP